jgi:hypothetical protein
MVGNYAVRRVKRLVRHYNSKGNLMKKVTFVFGVVLLSSLACDSAKTINQVQPLINTFCELYSNGEYDSIITLLRINKGNNPNDTAGRKPLLKMFKIFKEEFGRIDSGKIGEIKYSTDTENGKIIEVIYTVNFGKGLGLIDFEFKTRNTVVFLNKFQFGGQLMTSDLYNKIQNQLKE